MMISNEIAAARDAGTWLVYSNNNAHVCLARLAKGGKMGESPDGRKWHHIIEPGYPQQYAAFIDELRIATPNDMLKYGE